MHSEQVLRWCHDIPPTIQSSNVYHLDHCQVGAMRLINRTEYLQRKHFAPFVLTLMVLLAQSGILPAPSHADKYPDSLLFLGAKCTCGVSGVSDTYRFHTPHSNITVRLVSSRTPDAALVLWTKNKKSHKQYLPLPDGWWPTTCDEHDTPKPLASALLWRVGRQTLLVIVGQRDSGIYDYNCPLIYHLREDHWRIIPNKTKALQFSNRGSFYIQGNKLYVWDYVAEAALSHGEPQHYQLREFALSQGQFALVKSRVTQGKYEDIQGLDDASGNIPAAFDPLREFGLRWRWWSAPAQ